MSVNAAALAALASASASASAAAEDSSRLDPNDECFECGKVGR